MSFKQGRFYAIQARDADGDLVYVESSLGAHSEKLKLIAKRAAKMSRTMTYDEEYDYSGRNIKVSDNPFALTTWPLDTKVEVIIGHMRTIRDNHHGSGINPATIKLVIVESVVTAYAPESPSDEETELRRFVLEKLTPEEQRLLRVDHWAVYNKLADRSNLEEEED